MKDLERCGLNTRVATLQGCIKLQLPAYHAVRASHRQTQVGRERADGLSAKVRVVLEPEGAELGSRFTESPIPYLVKRLLQPAAKRSLRPKALRTAFRLARLGLPRRESWR